jgi:ketosteroid isomerase-like protein
MAGAHARFLARGRERLDAVGRRYAAQTPRGPTPGHRHNERAALIVQRGRIKGSSHELEHRVAWDCEVRDGRVARVHPYFSWEEGLEAVGLAELP